MRRITLWVVSTIAALVLLFSYRTSTMGATSSPAAVAAANPPGIVSSPAPAGPPAAGSGDPGGETSPSPASGASTPPQQPPGGSLVVNGTVAETPYGPVQVQVHLTNSKITDVKALQLPHGERRDEEINAYAVPQLRDEVLAAQNANIDVVSGATYTSEGYVHSLQAALDAAHSR